MTPVVSLVALPARAAESNADSDIGHADTSAHKVQPSKTSHEISPNSCEIQLDDSSDDDDELIVREVSCLDLDLQPDAVSGAGGTNMAVHPLSTSDRQEDVRRYDKECSDHSNIGSHEIGSTDSGVSASESRSIQPLQHPSDASGNNGICGKTFVSEAEDTQNEYHLASYECESTSSDDNSDFVMYEVEVSKSIADDSDREELQCIDDAGSDTDKSVIQEESHELTVAKSETHEHEATALNSQNPSDDNSDGFDVERIDCLDSAAIQNIRRASRLVSSVEQRGSLRSGNSKTMSINDEETNAEPQCEVIQFDEEIEGFLSGGFRRFGDLFEAQEKHCTKFEEHFAILSSFDEELQRGHRISKGAGGQRKRHSTNCQASSDRAGNVTRVKLAATNPRQFKALFAAHLPFVVSGCTEDASERGNRPWALATFTNLLGNERVVRLKLPGVSDPSRHSYVHVTARNFATWLGMGEKNRYALATCCADSMVGSHAGLLVEESLVRQQCRTGLRPHESCVGLLDMVWAPVGFSEPDYDDGQCARTFSILSGTLVASCFSLTLKDPRIMEFETARGDCVFVPCGWAIKFRHATRSSAAQRGGDEYVLWVTKKWQVPSDTVAV